MKKLKTIFFVAITVSFLFIGESCKKDDASEFENAEYSISTGDISQLNGNFAVASGKLRMSAGKVSSYGHCWSTYQGATIGTDDHTTFGPEGSTKEFSSELAGLQPGTFYYVRTYAKGKEVVYGNEIPFRTPTVQVNPLILKTQSTSSVKLEGRVNVYSGAVGQYGFCYAFHDNPSIFDSKTENFGLPENGKFNYTFSNMHSNMKYYFRAYAQGDQMAYGPVMEVVLDDVIISDITLEQVSDISVLVRGSIEVNSPVTYGVCWSTEPEPDLNDNFTEDNASNTEFNYTKGISDLEKAGTYYFRAYVKSEDTIRYSQENSITLKFPFKIAGFPGEGRINAGSFILNGDTYVGLGKSNQIYEDLYKYVASENEWVRMADIPTGLATSDIGVNKDGYVFYRHTSLKIKGYKFLSSSNSWIELPELYLGFNAQSISSFTYQGNVYVSMLDNNSDELFLWKYSDNDQMWTKIGSHSTTFSNANFAFVLDGVAYWGCKQTNSYTFALIRFDFGNNSWNNVKSYYFDSKYITFFEYEGKGYVKEGNSTVYRYNAANKEWIEVNRIQDGGYHGAVLIQLGGELVVGLGRTSETGGTYSRLFYPYNP